MPKAPNWKFSLPDLLEQIFLKYSKNNNLENLGDLFVELNTLLGARVVKAAVHLLDFENIVIYRNPLGTREIAEIRDSPSSKYLVRLFPRINYCTCDCFQHQILNALKSSEAPYTCEHILVLRLATLTKSDRIRFEELPSNKLDLLLNHFLHEDDQEKII